MGFQIDPIFDHCCAAIEKFAREHRSETFYGFAIDASLLCLNSEEKFIETLEQYRREWVEETSRIESIEQITEREHKIHAIIMSVDEEYKQRVSSDPAAFLDEINRSRDAARAKGFIYDDETERAELKANTGDWDYQGFADLNDCGGWDDHLYQHHYHKAGESKSGRAGVTKYSRAMSRLVRRLRESRVFQQLNRTDDFFVTWVEHNY